MRNRQLPAVLLRALLVAALLLVPGWRGPAEAAGERPAAGPGATADRGALGDAVMLVDRAGAPGSINSGQARRDHAGRALPLLLAVLAVLLGLVPGRSRRTGPADDAPRPRPAPSGARAARAPPVLQPA
jgi:hypothetical protein